jgi:heterogeneous nuclear ribonucleoprotein A1/A3
MNVNSNDKAYLQQSFEKFGEIKSVKIINSVKTKKPKRFAIVTFNHYIPSSILMQDHWIMGRKVDVKEYLSGEEANNKLSREKQRKVFVGGLPLTVNNEILKGYFQQFGKVIEANIVYNHETMRSRGFGFVIFQDEKTVQEVLKRYDDHYLYGKWVTQNYLD